MKPTTEQKVAAAAGPQNTRNSAATNQKVAAVAPPPRPTPNLTRDMVVSQRGHLSHM